MNILLLRLESPMLAFGGVMVDNYGFTDDIPSASMLTGLLGNALGYRRSEHVRLQALQDCLLYAVRIDRAGQRVRDYQTALLFEDDQGWTTRGSPEGREKSPSYKQHVSGRKALTLPRYRDYYADAAITVALTLAPESISHETLSIDELSQAMQYPIRPLFIGRKSCIPATPVFLAAVQADSLEEALQQASFAEDADSRQRLYLPEAHSSDARGMSLHGQRNWRANVHQGRQWWSMRYLENTSV